MRCSTALIAFLIASLVQLSLAARLVEESLTNEVAVVSDADVKSEAAEVSDQVAAVGDADVKNEVVEASGQVATTKEKDELGTNDDEEKGKGKRIADPNVLAAEAITEGCVGDHAVQFEKIATELDLPHRTEAEWLKGIFRFKLDIGADEDEDELPVLYSAVQNRFEIEKSLANMGGGLYDKIFASENRTEMRADLQAAKNLVKAWGFSVTGAKKVCMAIEQEPRPESVGECMAEVIKSGHTYKRSGWLWGTRGNSTWPVLLPRTTRQLKQLSVSQAQDLIERLSYDDEKENAEYRQLNDLVEKAVVQGHAASLPQLIEVRVAKQQRYDLLTKFTQRSYQKGTQVKESIARADAELQRAKKILKGFGFSFDKTKKECIKQRKHESPKEGVELLARILKQNNDVVQRNGLSCDEKPGMYCSAGMAPKFKRKAFDYKTFLKIYMTGVVTWGNPVAVGIMGGGGFLIGGPPLAAVGVGLALGTPTEWILPLPVALWFSADFFPKCRCNINPCEYDQDSNRCTIKRSGKSTNPFEWLPYPGQKCVMRHENLKSGLKSECALQQCVTDDFNPETSINQVHGKFGMLQDKDAVGGVYNCLADNEGLALWQRQSLADLMPGQSYNTSDVLASTQAFTTLYSRLLGPMVPPPQAPELLEGVSPPVQDA